VTRDGCRGERGRRTLIRAGKKQNRVERKKRSIRRSVIAGASRGPEGPRIASPSSSYKGKEIDVCRCEKKKNRRLRREDATGAGERGIRHTHFERKKEGVCTSKKRKEEKEEGAGVTPKGREGPAPPPDKSCSQKRGASSLMSEGGGEEDPPSVGLPGRGFLDVCRGGPGRGETSFHT